MKSVKLTHRKPKAIMSSLLEAAQHVFEARDMNEAKQKTVGASQKIRRSFPLALATVCLFWSNSATSLGFLTGWSIIEEMVVNEEEIGLLLRPSPNAEFPCPNFVVIDVRGSASSSNHVERMFAVAQSAFFSEKYVRVALDDEHTDEFGHCYVMSIGVCRSECPGEKWNREP